MQAVEAFTTERASGAISCEGDSRRLQGILLAQRDSENELQHSPSTSLTRTDIRYLEDTCRSYSTTVAVTILEHDCYKEPLPPAGTRCALVWNVISLTPLTETSISPEEAETARTSVVEALRDAIESGEKDVFFP